jgi:hypothetical protein
VVWLVNVSISFFEIWGNLSYRSTGKSLEKMDGSDKKCFSLLTVKIFLDIIETIQVLQN